MTFPKNTTAVALTLALLLCSGCDLTDDGATDLNCRAAAANTIYAKLSVSGSEVGTGLNDCEPTDLATALASGRKRIVVTGDGSLAKGVVVPDGVTIDATVYEPKTARLVCPADDDCVRFEGTGHLRGVILENGGKHGVVAAAGSLWLQDVEIKGMKGDGVHAEGSVNILVQSTKIIGNTGRGIYGKGIGALAVIDPVYAPSPLKNGSPIGVIDPVYSPGSQIADNGQGGIAVIDPVYSPKADKHADPIAITNTSIAGNGRYGVGLWGSSLTLKNSLISGTKATSDGPWADGLLVAKGSAQQAAQDITVDDTTLITDNARTGVLVAYDAKLQLSGAVANNGLGGIWAHGDKTTVTLQKTATVRKNKAVGVVVTKGAALEINGATVSENVRHEIAKNIEMGDGIGVYNGASAVVRDAALIDNERAAIVVHSAKKNKDGEADVVVKGCTMKGSEYTFVINGAPVPLAAAADRNQAESSDSGSAGTSSGGGSSSGGNNKSNSGYAENADLPVQTGYCSGKDPDEAGTCTAAP